MLELHILRNKPEFVKERLAVRHFPQPELVDTVLELDAERRRLQTENDKLLSQANKLAKQIGELYKSGRGSEAEQCKAEAAQVKEQTKQLAQQLQDANQALTQALEQLPNLPHQSVPSGKSEADNVVLKEVGTKKELPPQAMPHWELIEKHQLASFDLGAKVTGAGFPFYIGKGAKLQRALIQYFLDKATQAGFTEIQAPLLVNEASAYATGQLPDKDGQMYHATQDDYYLIPTAEVPLTNIYRDVILTPDQLPVKVTGYTPCFRREAGSYGKDVRGLNRLHQFDKVEIVQLTHPNDSYQALEQMLAHVESLLQALELPYRLLQLCGGDATFTSAKTVDFEVWSAAQKRWLEVSSVSNFETFQANRLKLRFKENNATNTQLCHTLNGSALALPRIVAALLENHQQADGSIKIPQALQAYTGFSTIS